MQKILSLLRRGLRGLFLSIAKLGSLVLDQVPARYKAGAGIAIALLAIGAIFIIGIHTAWALTAGTATFTVEGRDRVVRGDTSIYEVYTSGEIYTNQDSYIRMKFGSADLQNTLRPGKTVECKTQGFRFRALHLMPNLIECQDVEAVQDTDGEIY